MRISNVGIYLPDARASNYAVVVETGADPGRDRGVVRGHPVRSASPWWLVAKAICVSGYELLGVQR
jgi:hypothetical protein